jgi:hypothetical protein
MAGPRGGGGGVVGVGINLIVTLEQLLQLLNVIGNLV